MGYTLRQAADEVGCSRSTIHRAIKAGRMSAHRDQAGSYSIDPAELARAFPRDALGTSRRDDAEQRRDGAETWQIRVLETQLQAEREKAALLRENLDGLRAERDEWRAQAARLTTLLAAPPASARAEPQADQAPPPPKRRRSWWSLGRQAAQ